MNDLLPVSEIFVHDMIEMIFYGSIVNVTSFVKLVPSYMLIFFDPAADTLHQFHVVMIQGPDPTGVPCRY